MAGKRFLCSFALVILLAMLVVASGFAQGSDNTLVMAWGGTDTFDTYRSALAAPLFVFGMVHDTLFAFDQDLQPQPVLVESWELSEDELIWSFKLKEGISFHNGTPFNAAELEAYFEGSFFEKSFTGWMFANVEDLVVTGEYSIDFVLSAPTPLLIYNLAYPWNIIQPQGAIDEYGEAYGYDALVGTGPFIFDEWLQGEKVVLKRNDDYTYGPDFVANKGPAHIEEIILREISEAATQINELRFGDVDYVGVASSQLEAVLGDSNVDVGAVPSYTSTFMVVNANQPNMQDWRMRAAVNHAIDRASLIQAGWFGAADVSYSLVTPASFGYAPGMADFGKEILVYDPVDSARLLDELGWVLPAGGTVREKDGEKLSVKLITFNFYQTYGEILTAMFSELGFEVELFPFEYGSFYSVIQEGDWHLFLGGWIDQSGFSTLQSNVTTAGIEQATNNSGYGNAALDALVDLMNTTTDPVVREQASFAAQQKVVSDLYYIPVVVPLNYVGVVADRVGGFDLLNAHPWRLGLIRALDLFIK